MKDNEAVLSDLDSIAWALLNAKADAVMLVDPKGTILFANTHAAQRFGKSVEDIIGSYIWDVNPSSNKSHHQILLNQVIQTGQPITTTYKDKERWNQTLIYPILGEDNQVIRIALCTYDITAQIDAEERFKQVLLELITAQEDERHRISQDLHDDVGQKMTALVFELHAIKEVIEKDQKVSLKEINAVISNMELIIKHVRQIFYQLYPPSLSRMALPKVLAGFCSIFEETNNIHVDFSCREDFPELPENYDKAIYRFVQEGLTNVIKHAKASAAWLNLDYIDDDLNISLEDNGLGFELEQVHEGIGLHGIRERFLMLGGGIEIESAPGKGTRLSGTIPFKADNF
jgi:PAS domain S-box-containing protein